MPYCEVGEYKQRNIGNAVETDTERVQIYYQTYGRGDIKVLLIMGFAATHEGWSHQILSLAGSTTPNEVDHSSERLNIPCSNSPSLHDLASQGDLQQQSSRLEGIGMAPSGIHVCAFDNRGVGKSSSPRQKSEYTTTIMAMDALAVMDHLGWGKVHVFGHSLGAMISCKLAAMFPDRIASLALLSVTGGGYETLPKFNWVILSLAFRLWKAKSPEERALVDLDTHYTQDYLEEMVGEMSRRQQLYKEYVKNISATGMQSNNGQNGQLNACWTHRVTSEDYQRIRTSSIMVSVIHGSGDVIAQVRHARTIAKKLAARLIELPGGHLITHQHTKEVNQALLELIQAAHSNLHPSEWQSCLFLCFRKRIICKCLHLHSGPLTDYKLHDLTGCPEDEEGQEMEDARSCGAFFKSVYSWLACGGSSSVWGQVYDCFTKKQQ